MYAYVLELREDIMENVIRVLVGGVLLFLVGMLLLFLVSYASYAY